MRLCEAATGYPRTTPGLWISIEDGKDYSENALKVAKHRERQMIEELLPGEAEPVLKLIREMFSKATVIRIPKEFPPYWDRELATFFKAQNLPGSTWWVPRRTKNRVTFSSSIEASNPQPVL